MHLTSFSTNKRSGDKKNLSSCKKGMKAFYRDEVHSKLCLKFLKCYLIRNIGDQLISKLKRLRAVVN